jgi:GNAT superfamily N-acetyltransferase
MAIIRRSTNEKQLRHLIKAIIPDVDIPRLDYFWIAYDKKEPIGFAVLTVTHCRSAFLSLGGVLPSHRGAGLHKRLIRVRLRHAKKLGIKHAITYTSKSNFKSYGSLQSCGFQLYSPEYEYVGEEFLYWQKKL